VIINLRDAQPMFQLNQHVLCSDVTPLKTPNPELADDNDDDDDRHSHLCTLGNIREGSVVSTASSVELVCPGMGEEEEEGDTGHEDHTYTQHRMASLELRPGKLRLLQMFRNLN